MGHIVEVFNLVPFVVTKASYYSPELSFNQGDCIFDIVTFLMEYVRTEIMFWGSEEEFQSSVSFKTFFEE